MIEIQVLASSSGGNCYRVTDGSTPLLIECGLPFAEIRRRLGFKTAEIAGCLISHEHQDHARAVREVMAMGIDCYISQGTVEAIGLDSHRVHVVRAREQFRINSWTILPFGVEHDYPLLRAIEPLGFLLVGGADRLLYLTDTMYCRYQFRELTAIMVEANYARDILDANVESGAVPAAMRQRLIRSHFSLEHVKRFLAANDLSTVREIHLLHLSDGNSDAARFKREIQELTGKPVYVAEK